MSGDEILASLLRSAPSCDPSFTTNYHVAHLPTHQAIADADKGAYVPTALPKSATHRKGDSRGEIWPVWLTRRLGTVHCRLYGLGKCKWGDASKRIHDDRARNPPPGLVARMDNGRNQRKRRRTEHAPNFRPIKRLGIGLLTRAAIATTRKKIPPGV